MLVTVRRASRARNTHTHSKVVQHAPAHWPGVGPTPGLTHPHPCPGVHVMTHGRCGARARRRRGGGAHWELELDVCACSKLAISARAQW